MSPASRQTSVKLSVIDEIALLEAIEEYNGLGRAKFLKKYGFSRSSKFYLIHEKRLYDTKALVSAAYRHATGKRLAHDRFGGGAQTVAIFQRLKKDVNRFRHPRCSKTRWVNSAIFRPSLIVSRESSLICKSWASPNGFHSQN